MSEENQRWMSSNFEQAIASGTVDPESGVIRGVSVCTIGEAKGLGVNLDREFIETVMAFGNEKKQGLKARFGHPNMCSTALGTFIGRFKNFTIEGEQVIADLFMSNEAKETPNGNLYKYIFGLARNESDMFGTSIVFTPGPSYKRNTEGRKAYRHERESSDGREIWDTWADTGATLDVKAEGGLGAKLFVECEALHACDAVDNPAANDGGLFSAFSQETVAGQITQFLDLNPQIWEVLESNPSITETLGRYGDKMDGFVKRYRETRQQIKGAEMSDEKLTAEPVEPVAELEATGTNEEAPTATAEPEAVETEEAPAEELEAETTEEEVVDEPEADEAGVELSKGDLKRMVKEFGADIATQTMLEGGDYNSALKLHAEQLKAENATLKTQNKELRASGKTTALGVKHIDESGKAKRGMFEGRMPEDKTAA